MPLAVGNRWTYERRIQFASGSPPTERQERVVVAGTRVVDGGQAFVVHASDPVIIGLDPGEQIMQVSATGLISHPSPAPGNSPHLIPNAPPFLEIPFPVPLCSTIQQYRSPWNGAEVVSTAFIRFLEPCSVPAGRFAEALRIERSVTVESSSGCFLFPKAHVTDWYARGVGRVKRTVDAPDTPPNVDSTYDLTGWMVDGTAHGVLPVESTQAKFTLPGGAIWSTPAVASDGSRFLVAIGSERSSSGALQVFLLGPDGKALATFAIETAAGAQTPVIAYGDGRYLVVYRVWNGGLWGLWVSAQTGLAMGAAFALTANTWQPALAYAGGVFALAHVQDTDLRLSVIDEAGARGAPTRPYPGEMQAHPAIASDGTNLLVVWERLSRTGTAAVPTEIAAGRVDTAGRPLDPAPLTISKRRRQNHPISDTLRGREARLNFLSPRMAKGQRREQGLCCS